MAVYKVAQDVEADDKLIGPFSFRQFIYLMIVAGSIALAWGLARVFIGLVIIPLPIIVFFGALALPLRKDQPMEIYLAAVMSFHLKPRKRLWVPDGVESLVTITAPKTLEVQRTKEFSGDEAERRLSYLARIADSKGWAIRDITSPAGTTGSMNADYYNEAQNTVDMLDTSGSVAQSLDTMIDRADAKRRQALMTNLHTPDSTAAIHASTQTPPPAAPQSAWQPTLNTDPSQAPLSLSSPATPATQPIDTTPPPAFNPYPTNIHQSVITPLGQQDNTETISSLPPPPSSIPQSPTPEQEAGESSSETGLSPDIINLANNNDLSIETIAREAHRIEKKLEDNEEVVISLR